MVAHFEGKTPMELRKLLAELNRQVKEINDAEEKQADIPINFLNSAYAASEFDVGIMSEGKYTISFTPDAGYKLISWTPGKLDSSEKSNGVGRFDWRMILIKWHYANNAVEVQKIPLKGVKSIDWTAFLETLALDDNVKNIASKVSSSKDRLEFIKTLPGAEVISILIPVQLPNTSDYVNGVLDNQQPVDVIPDVIQETETNSLIVEVQE